MIDSLGGMRRAGLAASVSLVSLAALAAAAGAGCSGSNDSGVTGSSLVSTCGQICDNVLLQCGVASTLYSECNSACDDLLLVPQSCATQFAGYLACLGGATSIHCESGGQTVELSPSSCAAQEEDYETCNGGPSPLAACVALPSSDTSCAGGGGLASAPAGTPEFCVGQPDGCSAAGDVPFGIGTYCCN